MKRAAPTRYGRKPEGVAALPEYRALTRNYLSEPDPARWAVLADLFEEHGDAGGAALWRRRAAWYPVLLAAYHAVDGKRPRRAEPYAVELPPWRLALLDHDDPELLCPYVSLTAARAPWPLASGQPTYVRRFHLWTLAAKRTYLVERLLGICDYASAVEALPAVKGGA